MYIKMHRNFSPPVGSSQAVPRKSSKGAGVLEDLGMSGVPKGREIWIHLDSFGEIDSNRGEKLEKFLQARKIGAKEYVGFKDQTNT